jgi:hypothetical protein
VAKNCHNLFYLEMETFEKENPMRIAPLIFGGFTVLAALTAPALAKNSHSQKIDDQPASPSCQAYQQAADGSWTSLPCQELGGGAQPQHKSAARKTDEDAH